MKKGIAIMGKESIPANMRWTKLGRQHPLVPEQSDRAEPETEEDRCADDQGEEEDGKEEYEDHGYFPLTRLCADSIVCKSTHVPISVAAIGIAR